MDIVKILEAQRKLDEEILKDVVINDVELLKNTMIALGVEFSEVANEVQFFKFWKKNKNTDQEKILEELADCLHFLLSIVCMFPEKEQEIVNDFEEVTNKLEQLIKSDNFAELTLTDLYLHSLQVVSEFKDIYLDHEYLTSIFIIICLITKKVGSSIDDLEQAYYKKNEKNYERIKNNY